MQKQLYFHFYFCIISYFLMVLLFFINIFLNLYFFVIFISYSITNFMPFNKKQNKYQSLNFYYQYNNLIIILTLYFFSLYKL